MATILVKKVNNDVYRGMSIIEEDFLAFEQAYINGDVINYQGDEYIIVQIGLPVSDVSMNNHIIHDVMSCPHCHTEFCECIDDWHPDDEIMEFEVENVIPMKIEAE